MGTDELNCMSLEDSSEDSNESNKKLRKGSDELTDIEMSETPSNETKSPEKEGTNADHNGSNSKEEQNFQYHKSLFPKDNIDSKINENSKGKTSITSTSSNFTVDPSVPDDPEVGKSSCSNSDSTLGDDESRINKLEPCTSRSNSTISIKDAIEAGTSSGPIKRQRSRSYRSRQEEDSSNDEEDTSTHTASASRCASGSWRLSRREQSRSTGGLRDSSLDNHMSGIRRHNNELSAAAAAAKGLLI